MIWVPYIYALYADVSWYGCLTCMPQMLTYHDMDPLYVCHMSCKQIFEYRSSKNTLHVCLICFRVMIWVPCMYAICPTNRSLSIEVEKRLICMPCMYAICPTNRSLQYRCRRTRGGKWRYGFVIGRQRRCVENTFCREHILQRTHSVVKGKWRYGFVIGRQRRCVQNVFSTECVLYRMCSLQKVNGGMVSSLVVNAGVFSTTECVLYRMRSLQNVFSTECVLYRTCSLQDVSSAE